MRNNRGEEIKENGIKDRPKGKLIKNNRTQKEKKENRWNHNRKKILVTRIRQTRRKKGSG